MTTVPARSDVPIESTWSHESASAQTEQLALEEDPLQGWLRRVSLK